MAAKQMHYTKEGYQALVDELDYLKTIRRAEVKEALATARSYGDLSENSEYDEARNEQALLEARIQELDTMLRNAKIVDNISTTTVGVGVSVTLYDYEFEEEVEYHIVGTTEVDLSLNRISNESPIGAALLGAKKNQVIEANVPAGVVKYKILSITK